MTTWEGINEFVAVAETQSFTKASDKLSTSVAHISRKVSALEERLAVKLFNRTTRQVTLTEVGQLYYTQCKELVEGLEIAELSISQMQSTPKGLIKVTAPATYGEQHISPLLIKFLKQYPEIELELILTNHRLDLIDAGIDLAIRLGSINDTSMIAKKLTSRQLHVCASQTYLDKYGTPDTLSDLKKHQCLVGSVNQWKFAQDGKEKSLKVSGRIECNSGVTLLSAAKSGLGLVQLPDYYVQDALHSGQLIEILKEYRSSPEGIWALYPHKHNLPPKVRLLVDFLSDHLSDP